MKAPAPALSLILNSTSISAGGILMVRRLAMMPSAAGRTFARAASKLCVALAAISPGRAARTGPSEALIRQLPQPSSLLLLGGIPPSGSPGNLLRNRSLGVFHFPLPLVLPDLTTRMDSFRYSPLSAPQQKDTLLINQAVVGFDYTNLLSVISQSSLV
jgi:hypothetical protein